MAGRGRIQHPQGEEGHPLRSGFNLPAASTFAAANPLKPENAAMSTNTPVVFSFTTQILRVVMRDGDP